MARTPSKSKPHLPYRGDDPTVGKKTGINVARVARTSDGYEPFHDLLSQANSRTPPRRKKKSIPHGDGDGDEDEQEDDEDEEEVSMDVDSPVQYATTPLASTSGRPSLHGTSVNFDAVPTPRARKSAGHAGPSRLKTLTARELLEQDEDEDDGGMEEFGYETAHEEQQEQQSPPRSKGKGKATEAPTPRRPKQALPPVEEDDPEDEISRGMEDVQQDASDDEEEEVAPPKKKAKSTRAPAAQQDKHKPKSRNQKENREIPAGTRRSKRVPYPPLEFWRGEKVVFAMHEEGKPRLVPHIKEIVRIPKEDPAVRRPASKRKRGQTRAASHTPQVIEREVIVEVPVYASNPEAGWDDETDPDAVVMDFRTGEPYKRRVAFTAKMFKPTAAAGGAWFFEKIFGDGDFMAAGQLVIPPQGQKPPKGTKDNTYIFFVVQGAVNVVVGETNAVVASGGMFMVPRGNSYFIQNIADRDAKIFFTQARKMREEDEDEHTSPPAPRAVSVAMAGARAGGSAGTRSGSTASGR
ncbi:Mif2/CENP-C like-domain-containing protein [Mycena belliarum]|uniref:CENP-C homolog n=1 Tax=Mycena belliarum TaxID=1033014 RepID=A0AAD6UN68_9AGAR|nr:Mif2/CENP-C like-domain-containing protein [Mycena belliae]